ncbi:uncharacterized protein [Nicotiana tomentosiformis]|uniref:uncharacterized protein n=1 Tax=Nicotiana tomentosiformis TaxID=4098 RepID=UPI00388CEA30
MEEAPPAVKKLLEAWLANTLTGILNKPTQEAVRENARTCIAPATTKQYGLPPSVTGITHNINNAGNDTFTTILTKMEEMENENKMLRDQMREHQERVDKIPGAPKLLPKRDASRFVEQPYSDEVAPHAIPKSFKMPPYLKIYDGTTDPEDHVTHYVTALKGNDLAKEQVSSILLKKFGETLTRGAVTWYSQLPARSIETFEEMADKFVIAYAGAKKAEARVNDIFAIKQSPGEGLRDFLARFNRVRMTLPNVSEGIAVAAFQNGLNRNGSRATRKDLAAPRSNRERHQLYVRSSIKLLALHEEGPSRPRIGTHQNERGMPPLLSAHNFCVSPSEIVYSLEKLGPKVKWPQKMRSDSSTRKSDALYEFHQERGHKTEDCIALRQEVLNMLHQGHLKELLSDRGRTHFSRGREQHQGALKLPSPTRTIQMIIGGGDDISINSINFATTHKLKHSISHERYDELEESIIFDKSDTHDLVFPHYDALVITLRILDTDVRRNMVDDGSGAYIIHPRVLAQIKLEDKIVLRCITLIGFNNAVERTSGEITLPILAGGIILKITFHIMDRDTAYNAIIGRPWIHAMRAIPSNLY